MRISAVHVGHRRICSRPLHTTVLVHQIIHWRDRSRAPDRSWSIHTAVGERTGYRRWLAVTAYRWDRWWRGRSLALLGGWRLAVTFFGFLLLSTFCSSVLKPYLNTRFWKVDFQGYFFAHEYIWVTCFLEQGLHHVQLRASESSSFSSLLPWVSCWIWRHLVTHCRMHHVHIWWG